MLDGAWYHTAALSGGGHKYDIVERNRVRFQHFPSLVELARENGIQCHLKHI